MSLYLDSTVPNALASSMSLGIFIFSISSLQDIRKTSITTIKHSKLRTEMKKNDLLVQFGEITEHQIHNTSRTGKNSDEGEDWHARRGSSRGLGSLESDLKKKRKQLCATSQTAYTSYIICAMHCFFLHHLLTILREIQALERSAVM